MIKTFFGNRAFVLFLLPFFIAGYTIIHTFSRVEYVKYEKVNLGFFGLYQESSITVVLSGLLVFTTAIILNNVFNRNEFREKNTYLPSLIYVVLASFSEAYYHLNGIVVSSLLIAIAIIQLFRLNQNEDGRKDVFNTSFLFGLAACFYPVMFLLFPLLFILVWVLRPFVMRESALMVVGYTLPLVYAGTFSYYMGYELNNTLLSPSGELENINLYIILALLVAILLITIISPLLLKLSQSGIRLKKLLRIFFLVTVAFIVVFLFEMILMNKLGGFYLMILPLSALLTYAFGDKELRPFPTFIFYLIFIISVGKFFYSFNF